MVRATALLGAVVTAGSLGVAPAVAIAHGRTATTGQFPYAVQLRMHDIPRPDGTVYGSACSAVLISRTWIMTAGHCFHDVNRVRVSGKPRYATTARLGTVNTTNPAAGATRTVNLVQQSGVNDIALARLSAPVDGIAPPKLTTGPPGVGRLLTLAGWGATTGAGSPSSQLYLGQVKVSAVGTSTVLVTGYRPSGNTSACAYDSGAPYVATMPHGRVTLVSIESKGPTCPHHSAETTSRVDVVGRWVRGIVTDLPR